MGLADGLKNYAKDRAIAGELPEVYLSKVSLDVAEELGRALQVTEAPIFVRDGSVVWANVACQRIERMTPDTFVTFVDKYVKVLKKMRKSGKGSEGEEYEDVRVSITAQVAKWILVSPFFMEWLRPLRKLETVSLPVMRDDEARTVELLPDGYDADSEIYTVSELPPLYQWTVEEGMGEITDLLCEFPFVESAGGAQISFAVQVLSMLNLFCANLLPRWTSRPAFVYNANTQKAGKSWLAKCAVSISTGSQVTTTLPKQSERGKLKETLNSTVLDAKPYLLFDNCVGLVEDADLAAFIQSPQWGDRRMRTQSHFVVENFTTLYLTGVDFAVGADMAARCCFVDLFVEEGVPGQRRFSRVLNEQWLMDKENRRRLLSALWAIVRHWAAAPPAERVRGEATLPGFESYTEMMGGIVMAAGMVDPFKRPASDVKDKTEQDFLELLADLAQLGQDPTLGRGGDDEGSWLFPEVIEICRCRGYFNWLIPAYDQAADDLAAAIRTMGTHDEDIDSRVRSAMGKILAKRSDGSLRKGAEATGRTFVVRLGDRDARVRFRAVGVASSRSRRYVVTVIGDAAPQG